MLNFQIPPPRRLCHSSFPDGSPRQGYLSGEATLGGLTFVCEIAFYENTRVRVGRLAQSQKIRGAFWSSFVYFSPEGRLASGKPVEDVSLKGFHFQAGQYIDFDPKGNPLGGFSATTQVVSGKKVTPGQPVKYQEGGLVPVTVADQPRFWRTEQKGSVYECALSLQEFSCGSHSGGGRFGEWGTSTTLREFLQGELQDFVKEYFPEESPEIIGLAQKLHDLVYGLQPYPFEFEKSAEPPPLGPLLKSFSWCEGYDGEYEYTVDVYQSQILWQLKFDEQWTNPGETVRQEVKEFLAQGSPPGFSGTRYNDDIRRFLLQESGSQPEVRP